MAEGKLKQIIISGIVFAVISQIVHTVGAMLSMDYYLEEQYFSVWSKIMMPAAGSPGTEFFVKSVALAFVTGALFAYVYTVVSKAISGEGVKERGLKYGMILFLVGTLPGMMSLFLLINLPFALIVFWILEGLIVNLLGGMAIVKISD